MSTNEQIRSVAALALDLVRLLQNAPNGANARGEMLMMEGHIRAIVLRVREVFMSQPMCLRLRAPVNICGDIHGQFYDLLRVYRARGFPPHSKYLFLGDYVDRGRHSIETIVMQFCYKILYPDTFFMLRGNHESESLNVMYGFFDEVKRRYNIRLYKLFAETFKTMPVAAEVSARMLCMHGGLSPDLKSLDNVHAISRPCEVASCGLLCDLLWADPEDGIRGFQPSNRGVSYVFGSDVLERCLQRLDLDLLVRGHQVMERGYGFFANRRLLTLFTAPDYCGEFDNDGAVLIVEEDLLSAVALIPSSRHR